MKRLITLLVLAILSNPIKAQIGPDLSFYVGTWRYINSSTNEELTIKLKQVVYTISYNNSQENCLIGTYQYKKNGVVILDNMNTFNTISPNDLDIPIFALSNKTPPVNNPLGLAVNDWGIQSLSGYYKQTTSFEGSMLSIVSTQNPKKIKWILKEIEHVDLPEDATPYGWTLPDEAIFTKID